MEISLNKGKSKAVIASKSAELKSLVLGQRELMWCADAKFWGKSSPVLFPAIGFSKNNQTVFDEKIYEMPKHGFARDMDFEAEKTADDTARFTVCSDASTRKYFPFDFDFTMSYTLSEDSLEILYEVKNKSAVPMPFCIGAHPAFACEDVGSSRLEFERNETVLSPVKNLQTGLFRKDGKIKRLSDEKIYKLDYSQFDGDVVYFNGISSKSVKLLDKNNKGVKVSWEGFLSLGVWTPAGLNAPFICIEPWCGCDDLEDADGVFASKPEVRTAQPDETLSFTMKIEAID